MSAVAVKSKPGRAEPLLVFIHVPKTAGTTVKTILRRQRPESRVRNVGNVLKGYERGRAATEAAGRQLLSDRETWAVKAHIPFGFQRYLPPDARYMTFLREPIERVISNYYHEARHPVRRGEVPRLVRAEDLLSAQRPFLDNLQTRMLSDELHAFDVPATPELLEQAKRNLRDRFVFVGITERFDESLLMLNAVLGLPLGTYRSEKAATEYKVRRLGMVRPKAADLAPEALEVIERHNELDRELYAFGCALFEQRLDELRGADFDADLAALRCALAAPAASGGPTVQARAERLRLELELSEARLSAADGAREITSLKGAIARLDERLGRVEGKLKEDKGLDADRRRAADKRLKQVERKLAARGLRRRLGRLIDRRAPPRD